MPLWMWSLESCGELVYYRQNPLTRYVAQSGTMLEQVNQLLCHLAVSPSTRALEKVGNEGLPF